MLFQLFSALSSIFQLLERKSRPYNKKEAEEEIHVILHRSKFRGIVKKIAIKDSNSSKRMALEIETTVKQ